MRNKFNENLIMNRIFNITFLLFIGGIIYVFKKGMKSSLKSQMKDKQKNYLFKTDLKTKFKDVAGMTAAKKELTEFVEFLKFGKKFKDMGAVMPKGALMVGPPGVGKTYLAKAIAGEAEVSFFYVSGSEFIEKYVGVGASRVREIFKQAQKKSPSLIFIDEIDAVAKKRDENIGNSEATNTLNQLLVEMDGFDTNSQVVVIGSTNLKDVIDPAILRPGRFDRIIEISFPNLKEREQIFEIYLKKVKLKQRNGNEIEFYKKRMATLTPGFSGADISNIVNEAAIIAVRNKLSAIDEYCFEQAIDKVIAGFERDSAKDKDQETTVAYHEVGHAIVGWFLEGGDPLLKLTIRPRSKGALGFAQYLPKEVGLKSKQNLLDEIACILGGRAAEEIFRDSISTGAYDDFQKASQIAKDIIFTYGMSGTKNNIR